MERYYNKIHAESNEKNFRKGKLFYLLILLIFLIFPIFQSANAQEQWRVFTMQNSTLPSNDVGSIVVDTNNVKWIGTDKGMVRIEGNNWQIFDTTNTQLGTNLIHPVALDKLNNIWCILGSKGIAKFDGNNWTIFDTTNSGIPHNLVADISVDANNIKWIATKGLAKFNDTTWVIYDTLNSGIPGNAPYSLYCDRNIKWVGTIGKGLGRFNDTSWINYIPGIWVKDVTVDFAGNVWIATYFSGLAKFNYSQNQWTVYNTTNSGLPDNWLIEVLTDKYGKWVGTQGSGLAYYNDTNWAVFKPSNSPLPGYGVFGLGLDSNRNLWICCSGGLAIYNPNGIVGLKNNISILPSNFVLYQNFPNPFNPITNIEYQISKYNLNIRLIIYDINGKEILKLVNQKQNIGKYRIKWDASAYPSGIYFYKLEVDNYSQTKKMVLLK